MNPTMPKKTIGQVWLQNEMTKDIYRSCAPWQKKFARRVLVVPMDPGSCAIIIRQVDAAIEKAINRWAFGGGPRVQADLPFAVLEAIGMRIPRAEKRKHYGRLLCKYADDKLNP